MNTLSVILIFFFQNIQRNRTSFYSHLRFSLNNRYISNRQSKAVSNFRCFLSASLHINKSHTNVSQYCRTFLTQIVISLKEPSSESEAWNLTLKARIGLHVHHIGCRTLKPESNGMTDQRNAITNQSHCPIKKDCADVDI